MSRKRDTNWTRDEITVLLDSIMEMTQMRAEGGRRTNSREVFEYAAKKLGEKGHTSRAEREKCRTKWKKMKEEFTHARRARETGQGRVAPGIEPFYSRMLEFINGNFDNISPHSTIVRRSSSISSNNTSTNNGSCNNGHSSGSLINGTDNGVVRPDESIDDGPTPSTTLTNNSISNSSSGSNNNGSGVNNRLSHAASRASARLAANSNGISSNDASETHSGTIMKRQTNVGASQFSSNVSAPFDARQGQRYNQRLSSPGNPVSISSTNNNDNNGNKSLTMLPSNGAGGHQKNHDQLHATTLPRATNHHNSSYSNHIHDNSSTLNSTANSTSNELTNHSLPAERDADISYRVSTGCRQIIIFGDHDVDIKFRGDCVTINKINNADHSNPPGTAYSSDA